MGRNRPNLGQPEPMADRQHVAARIRTSPAIAPGGKLRHDIGRRLPGKRRIGRAHALAPGPVARRACLDVSPGVAVGIKSRTRRIPAAICLAGGGKVRIVKGHAEPIPGGQAHRHGAHCFVLPPAIGVIIQLPMEIPRIKACQPWCAAAVSLAIGAMTGHAGMSGAAIPPAQCNQFTRGAKRIPLGRGRGSAPGNQRQRCQRMDCSNRHTGQTVLAAPGSRLFACVWRSAACDRRRYRRGA